jgi:hypothetical protein
MSLEITGRLAVKNETQQIKESFKKRDFVLEISEEVNGKTYTNFAQFQLVQNRCDILDGFNVGDTVKVSFNIKGNKWEKDGKTNYITNLDAWRIEVVQSAPVATPVDTGYGKVNTVPLTGMSDDLPF